MRAVLRRKIAVALVAFVAAALACVTNPVTGQREISLMSVEQERAAGAQAAKQVAEQIGLVEDPALDAYIDAIGQRLAQYSPRQDVTYQFAVADMAEPNAFALPGGWIYVSRGLLAISNSETELANVIGHEIAHVAARHSAQRQTRSVGVGLLSVLGAVVAGAAGGQQAAAQAMQLGQAVGAGLIASYGRSQENESDDIGQRLSAQAGWDPRGMASFLQTLQRESVLRTGQERMPSFLDSHPMTSDRVQATSARAGQLGYRPQPEIAGSHAAFLRRLSGLLLGSDPKEGIFRDELFLHPGLDFTLQFPSGWQTANQKAAVGAQAPNGGAQLVLRLAGPTGDPNQAAQQFVQQNQLRVLDQRSRRIGGLDALQLLGEAATQQGVVTVLATFYAHPEAMFMLTGAAPQQAFAQFQDAMQRTASSFRGLTRAERGSITVQNLAIVQARRGESLAALSRRTGNAWTTEETAVANALAEGHVFRGGELVKIAEEKPWRG